MSLLQMSFSGAVMIVAIIVIRALAINKLPKKIFVLLWEAVLLRLLLPFSVPSMLSAYSIVRKNTPIQETLEEIPVAAVIAQVQTGQQNGGAAGVESMPAEGLNIWLLLYMTGMLLCALFFAVSYLRCHLEFRTSMPVRNGFAVRWLKAHRLKRTVQIRQSDRISTPLTYGILKPVILMPSGTDWDNAQRLQYVLLHEYMHIRHFDIAVKLIMAAALCIHWFNPFVWVLYVLFNRDIELACDESVVRRFGEKSRSNYAMTLITMEEEKSGLTPLYNHFSKNAIEERIVAIMKTKKLTVWAVIISAVVLAAVVILFATSAGKEAGSSDIVRQTAEQLVKQQYEASGENYRDWRINSLEQVYTYDELGGMTLQVYCLNYEFLAEDPEKVTLAGGMTMDEEGWIMPGYANSFYLVFQQEEKQLTYLTALLENDCFPGDEGFTSDLKLQLGMEQEEAAVLTENEERSQAAQDTRADTMVIRCTVEGLEEEMPATLYVGNGFSIYIPDKG